jgi:hypothetical protein
MTVIDKIQNQAPVYAVDRVHEYALMYDRVRTGDVHPNDLSRYAGFYAGSVIVHSRPYACNLGEGQLQLTFHGTTERSIRFNAVFGQVTDQITLSNSPPNLHLSTFLPSGVFRRSGIGGYFLDVITEFTDILRLPLMVTTCVSNVPFYQKHGFELLRPYDACRLRRHPVL